MRRQSFQPVRGLHLQPPVYWYRYEEGDQDNPIVVDRYRVVRFTEHGAWLDDGIGFEFFVKNSTEPTYEKRFAWPTTKQAELSYRRRKYYELMYIEKRKERISRALRYLDDPSLQKAGWITQAFSDAGIELGAL